MSGSWRAAPKETIDRATNIAPVIDDGQSEIMSFGRMLAEYLNDIPAIIAKRNIPRTNFCWVTTTRFSSAISFNNNFACVGSIGTFFDGGWELDAREVTVRDKPNIMLMAVTVTSAMLKNSFGAVNADTAK